MAGFLFVSNMNFLYIIIPAIIVLFVLVSLFRPVAEDAPSADMPYKLRPSVMNASEAAFFFELKKQLPAGYYIFPKIRVIDFIDPNSKEYSWRNKIWAKHVDFLVCDTTLKPALAIEVNGGSHNRSERIESDDTKRAIFHHVNLPLEFVNVGTSFADSIARIITALRPMV